MKRIALAGGASCGKTSLARHLTTELYNNMDPKRNAQQITEFARDYINECRRANSGEFVPQFADQQMFFREQLRREDSLDPTKVEFMITDSPIFLTIIYAWPMVRGEDYQSRNWYLKLYEEWLTNHVHRYDHTFILAREKAFFEDGTRGGTQEGAEDIHDRVIGFLRYHELPFIHIGGSDMERVEKVLEHIL
jgi:nicotinamide riboside kinase